jgi:hypothetical protein
LRSSVTSSTSAHVPIRAVSPSFSGRRAASPSLVAASRARARTIARRRVRGAPTTASETLAVFERFREK